MQTILIVIHVFLSIGLVALILLQHGKGADAGAAFGSGASSTVFGAQGSANFLSRSTAILATAFFLTTLTMGWYSMQATEQQRGSLMEGIEQQQRPLPSSDALPNVPERQQQRASEEIPQASMIEPGLPGHEGVAESEVPRP